MFDPEGCLPLVPLNINRWNEYMHVTLRPCMEDRWNHFVITIEILCPPANAQFISKVSIFFEAVLPLFSAHSIRRIESNNNNNHSSSSSNNNNAKKNKNKKRKFNIILAIK